jgi:hypothetical protein
MSSKTEATIKKLAWPVLAVAVAVAGCGPAASGSLGAAPTGAARTAAHSAPATPARSTAAAPPASSPAASPAPPPAPSPTVPACSQAPVLGGTFEVCPAAAAVGATVTISSDTTCGAGTVSGLTLVFLGPKAYVGSSGGGEEVPITKTGAGFTATYRIPATYVGGGNASPTLPVTPGTGYSFATYPAAGCDISFTVTR